MLWRVFFITVCALLFSLLLTGFIPEVFLTKFKLTFRFDNLIMFFICIASTSFLTVLAMFEIRSLKSKLKRREAEYSELQEKCDDIETKLEEQLEESSEKSE